MTKVLVIEDEHLFRHSILEILMYEGFKGIGAKNGRIGVRLAKEHLPDLIFCDILMPELNGYGVLAELRNNPVTATIPFIFLTSKAGLSDVRKGRHLGVNAYLTKPFKIDELLATIHAQLKTHDIVLT